jgi:hypothetical protein
MPARLRALLQNLALLLFSLALSIVVTEVALRLLLPAPKGGKEQLERIRYTEHDPVLGWRKKPGASVRFERRDFSSHFTINAHGLRGKDRPYGREPGVARALLLGDSFVEAFMVDDPRTPAARLEAELAGGGCRADVINGGTTGYSTDQEYLFFRDEGRKYRADVVVLYVYHNDIPYLVLDDNLGFPKPLLSFDSDPPVVTNLPVPAYVPPSLPPPSPPPPPRFYLWEFVKSRLERSAPRTYNRLAAIGLWEPLRRLPLNEELNLYHLPELGHLRPAWSAFTWTLESLDREVQASGGRLVIAYVPSRMEVQDSVWELTKLRYGLSLAYHRHTVARRVGYIATRLHLPFVDLTEPLTEAEGLLSPVYFATDNHWNARGMAVAARALAHDLLTRHLLPGC